MQSGGNKEQLTLRLFVVPDSDYCMIAIRDLELFVERMKGNYNIQLDVVDITEDAQAAEDEGIIATPTLIKKLPVPEQRLVGSFKEIADLLNL